MKMFPCLLAVLSSAGILAADKDRVLHSFQKIELTNQFWAEGAHFADFNRDGNQDIVSGPFWYEGPGFKNRHEYSPATQTFERTLKDGTKEQVPGYEGFLGSKNAYSGNFFAFTHDLNRDGWTDILIIGFPGEEVAWFENPKGAKGHWPRHGIFAVADNESPTFADLTGDGLPELVLQTSRPTGPGARTGRIGYATPDWDNPTRAWTFHPVTPEAPKWQRYTHGLGFGDVNGDGRNDILEKDAWWEQPASLAGDPLWKEHPFPFAPKDGSSHMFAYDVDGDGDNDVVTSLAAHGFGLAWYENVRENGAITFKAHRIMGSEPAHNRYGVKFSQLHAVDLIDMDGDGLKDIVTGKRIWAHGPTGDVEPNAPAVLYWFKLVRDSNHGVDFVPYQIDNASGVGTQVVVGDVSGNGLPDIVVGNKKGTFVFLHTAANVSESVWTKAQPKPVAGAHH
jgi:hypothetical protein